MNFKEYFRTKSLLKIPKEGIHFEQKTTPDLIWCVSHVIIALTKNNHDLEFSDIDIRLSPLFDNIMQDYFSKPPQNQAENEYNKVSSYQLGLLCYAGLITQVGNYPKKYRINNFQLLEYIAINDLNASRFLTEYTEKFLSDNGLISHFEHYKTNPTQENYLNAKDKYWGWAKTNTAIRETNQTHTNRVFNKLFNVYCYSHNIPGESGSVVVEGSCPYSFLIYNRENFRDKNKPSDMTREEHRKQVLSEVNISGVVTYVQMQHVRDEISNKYNCISEIKDKKLGFMTSLGIHVHHIIPQSSHPQFSLYRENLIAITPGQHLSLAHPYGNTQRINPDFQKVCLKKKFQNIKISINNDEKFYIISHFIEVLNCALNLNIKNNSTIEIIDDILVKI